MNIWFIGDIHGGHRNVHKFRKQFQSEEDHFQHVKELAQKYQNDIDERSYVALLNYKVDIND